MGLLNGFKHDIFISYNHADDLREEVPLKMNGWVGSFANKLKGALDNRLKSELAAGGVAGVDVFWDYQLEKNHRLSDGLRQHVEQSALFLVVMSNHYLESEWCGRESEWFQEVAARRSSTFSSLGSSFCPLILAHVGKTEPVDWPPHLRGADLLGYAFYHKDVTTGSVEHVGNRFCYPSIDVDNDDYSNFYREFQRLVNALKAGFQVSLKEARAVPGNPSSSVAGAVSDFTSPGTVDAQSPSSAAPIVDRAQVPVVPNNVVSSNGAVIVPLEGDCPELDNLVAALDECEIGATVTCEPSLPGGWNAELADASVMAVILGKPDETRATVISQALDAAERRNLTVLCWFPGDITFDKIDALPAEWFPQYKALIDRLNPAAQQSTVAEFAGQLASVRAMSPPVPCSKGRIRIYVDADKIDRDIVDQLWQTLQDGYIDNQLRPREIAYKFDPPLYEASTKDNNKVWERVKDSNGVLVVYGRIDIDTLDRKLDAIEKKSIEREADTGEQILVSIHDGPKPTERMIPPPIYSGFRMIDARRPETYREEIVQFIIDLADRTEEQHASA